jgi:hypothetical protein
MLEYQNMAKQLFKKINAQSPERFSLEAGPLIFQ